MTYREHYEAGAGRLAAAGVPEPAVESRLILEAVCGTRYGDLLAHGDRVLTGEEEERLEELMVRRCERIPLAYLLGECEFMGRSFRVTWDVLIPNPDTELLAEEALTLLHDGMSILELCTGSGCIALSLLSYTNDTKALATDISGKALKVAGINAERLGLSDRIELVECDLFPGSAQYDMLIANPPYVETDVIPTLEPEVSIHEPVLALDGGEDGLCFYRRIAAEAGHYLYSGGYILLEIGDGMGAAVSGLLEENGYSDIHVIRDHQGKDRVVTACSIDWRR